MSDERREVELELDLDELSEGELAAANAQAEREGISVEALFAKALEQHLDGQRRILDDYPSNN